MKLHKSMEVPVLLQGGEAWAVKNKEKKKRKERKGYGKNSSARN
jgi:hypothetical protein